MGSATGLKKRVALLRGVNVGSKNKLPMRDLVTIFEEAGATEVRTYIQSGNVVFAATARTAATLPERVSKLIHERFGIRSPVIPRTGDEMQQVIAAQPFAGEDQKSLHVAFLADKPTPARAAMLDPDRSPGDRFQLVGRELYLHLSNGVARTKLTNAWLDSTLDTVSTFRNWRTVGTLASMLET